MPQQESRGQPYLPSSSFDAHFANVSRLQEVNFDAERCAELLTHPSIGFLPPELSRLHIYIRPDYELGYSRKERRELRKANPNDYDDAASTETLLHDGPFGRRGDILITIAYGAGFNPNALLCHEAIHACKMLRQNKLLTIGHTLLSKIMPTTHEKFEAQEEAEANRAMKDTALKGLCKGVIEVIRASKNRR
jgi:hypothetical protein